MLPDGFQSRAQLLISYCATPGWGGAGGSSPPHPGLGPRSRAPDPRYLLAQLLAQVHLSSILFAHFSFHFSLAPSLLLYSLCTTCIFHYLRLSFLLFHSLCHTSFFASLFSSSSPVSFLSSPSSLILLLPLYFFPWPIATPGSNSLALPGGSRGSGGANATRWTPGHAKGTPGGSDSCSTGPPTSPSTGGGERGGPLSPPYYSPLPSIPHLFGRDALLTYRRLISDSVSSQPSLAVTRHAGSAAGQGAPSTGGD